jgi:hypothetical protein
MSKIEKKLTKDVDLLGLDELKTLIRKDKMSIINEEYTNDKKDWLVTIKYTKIHEDTYVVKGENKEQALLLATHNNLQLQCLKEREEHTEDHEPSIKEYTLESLRELQKGGNNG